MNWLTRSTGSITKIIAEENEKQRASWLSLISLAKDVLTACIDLLGIEAPERM